MSAPNTDIALYLPNVDGGGAERMMVTLASGFSARGFNTDLVMAKARGPYLELIPEAVRVVDLSSAGVTASLPKLTRYLQKRRPRATLATLNHASVVAIAAKTLSRVPTRVVNRESNMLFPNRRKSLVATSLRNAVRIFYPLADHHIGVSQGVSEDISRFAKVPAHKVSTIYNPVVNDDLFKNAAEPSAHPWLTPGEPPVILGVGRLAPQKDFGTLLRAFATVRAQTCARLVILGEGNARDALLSLAQDLGVAGDVALPGFVQNPFAYMSRADTFVLSSKHEGLPGALIQAMACGAKVVSTDCPSGPREILKGGTLAPLVPVGDVEALACAIKTSLETPLSPALKARALEFSEDAIIPQYLDVLLPGWRTHAPKAHAS